jgi:hypothetical protein
MSAGYFRKARGGEHILGTGVKGRRRHPGCLERGHVDRMPLHGCRAMPAGELDSRFQEGQSDTGSPVTTVDGEACDPPDSGIIRGEHSRQSLVAGDTWEAGTRSYPGPSGGMTIDVRDEPRRYCRALDLLAQRVPIVWCRLFSQVFRCCGAEEELTPAPRRVPAAPAEHRDQVIPPIRSRGTDIDGHDPHHRATPAVTKVTAGEVSAHPTKRSAAMSLGDLLVALACGLGQEFQPGQRRGHGVPPPFRPAPTRRRRNITGWACPPS